MKILIVAGTRSEGIAGKVVKRFGTTTDVAYINYPDDIENYLNRGDDFSRAIIFPAGYSRDESLTDGEEIINSIYSFIQEAKSKISRFEIVFIVNNKELGFGIVNITSDMASNICIMQVEDKIGTNILYNCVNEPLDKLRQKYKIIDMNLLKAENIKNAKAPEIGGDPFATGESILGELDSSPDDWGSFGDDIGKSSDDPFADSSDPFGDSNDPFGESGDPFGDSNDPFAEDNEHVIKQEKAPDVKFSNPFGDDSAHSNDADPFKEQDDTGYHQNETFRDETDPFAENNGFDDEPEEADPFGEDDTKASSSPFDGDELDNKDPFGDHNNGFEDIPAEEEADPFEDSSDPFGSSKESEADPFGDTSLDDPFGEDTGNSGNGGFNDEGNSGIPEADPFGEEDEYFGEPVKPSKEINSGVVKTPDISDFDEPSENFKDPDDFSNSFDDNAYKKETDIHQDSTINKLFEDEDTAFGPEVEDEPDEIEEEAPARNNKAQRNKNNNKRQHERKQNIGGGNVNKLKEKLDVFKRNGCIITVTGGKASGKTTVAGNLANILCKFGYSVLVIDMDTMSKGQTTLNQDNFVTINSGRSEQSALKSALGSTSDRIGRFVSIVRPGFHVLGTSTRADKISYEDIENKYINRFLHNCQNSYNFIIVDIPFEAAADRFADMVTIANQLVITERLDNAGLMDMLIDMSNIEDEDMTDAIFEKAKVVFNMDYGAKALLGKKVNKTSDVLNALDIRLNEVIGFNPDYSFSDLEVVYAIKHNNNIKNYILDKKYYSDTVEGKNLFVDLLCKIFEV